MSQNIQCATCTSLRRMSGYKHEQVALNRAQVTQTKYVHVHGREWADQACHTAADNRSKSGNQNAQQNRKRTTTLP